MTEKNDHFCHVVGFLYLQVMNFSETDNVKGPIISANFLEIVDFLVHRKTLIYHLHITGNVVGYAHSFCNLKVKENKMQTTVIAHNLFGFGFFFFLKGLRLGTWRTRDLTIDGKILANINFAYIANQAKFIDFYKYYQQSLSVLTSTMTDKERSNIKKSVENLSKMIQN